MLAGRARAAFALGRRPGAGAALLGVRAVPCAPPPALRGLGVTQAAPFHSSGGGARDTWVPWDTRGSKDSHVELHEIIEQWGRGPFVWTGAGLTIGLGFIAVTHGPLAPATIMTAVPVGLWWWAGWHDMTQTRHTILRNYPVIGRLRFLLESIRPEIRQYFIESELEANPIARNDRTVVYQRAKGARDSLPFGTKDDVYATGHEWANHSLYPKHAKLEDSHVLIGGPACTKPYKAALLNVSAMSYGALSANAVLALNTAAKMGGFSHNTGEGGVSRFHREPGGDLVWNVGTGYFGCRARDGSFSPERFKETAAIDSIKMIEIKLSQGAKPAHGGILPRGKITPEIAAARGIGTDEDCLSPPAHSAFGSPHTMMEFIAKLRELSGGKPIGFKLCVGRPDELLALTHAMVDTGITPDFITVDGAEGGTGAAPLEFSNSIGMPLVEGLRLTHNALVGTGLRKRVKLISSGRVLTGMNIVRNVALGACRARPGRRVPCAMPTARAARARAPPERAARRAPLRCARTRTRPLRAARCTGADLCNAARAMMFALGCIQSLKCNTNKCPTGVTSQEPALMAGLVVEDKSERVLRYQRKTVEAALEIVGAIGLSSPKQIEAKHIFKRVSSTKVLSYEQQYPTIEVRAAPRQDCATATARAVEVGPCRHLGAR